MGVFRLSELSLTQIINIFPTLVGVFRWRTIRDHDRITIFPTLVGVFRGLEASPQWDLNIFPTLVGVFRTTAPGSYNEIASSPRWWGCSDDEVARYLCLLDLPHAGGGVPLSRVYP